MKFKVFIDGGIGFKEVEAEAFKGNKEITGVVIGKGVTRIGERERSKIARG